VNLFATRIQDLRGLYVRFHFVSNKEPPTSTVSATASQEIPLFPVVTHGGAHRGAPGRDRGRDAVAGGVPR
jgi:hypothetical protein